MRRFSQRNSLVTLSDINITPLLDLAFVLLIIFIITTPLLEKGLPLQLPTGVGQPDVKTIKEDIRTLEVTSSGNYYLQGQLMLPNGILRQLTVDFQKNPNLVVFIRADNGGRIQLLANALDLCTKAGISAVSIRGEASSTLPK